MIYMGVPEKCGKQDNPDVIAIYKEFLGKPNSHKAHELLHTHYVERDNF